MKAKQRRFQLNNWLWVIVLAMGLSGCRQTARAGDILDTQVTFEQAVVAELPTPAAYRIGINTEVTGTGAQIGDLSLRAARLAIEEINSGGGVNGVPLELVVRDARSNPATALEQYQKAVAEDNLDALLGPFKSAYGVLIVPEHKASRLPMFIGATNATLTQQGVENLFRMRPSDRLAAPAMLALTQEYLHVKRIGLVHDTDAFGSGGADAIETGLSRFGLQPAVRLGYQTGITKFDSLVQKLAAANVDAVLIYGTNQTDVGHLLRAIRYWDLNAPIVTSPSGSSIVTRNVAAEAQDGIYVMLDALLTLSPEGQHLQQAFARRFGLQPDTYIAWYYDAVHLLAAIWREHPQAAGPELSRLIRVSDFQGAQGRYCFDARGEGLHSVVLAQMRSGVPEPIGIYGDKGLDMTPPTAVSCPPEQP
jgi:branched-chain amino acid transport system substrate-binding protein